MIQAERRGLFWAILIALFFVALWALSSMLVPFVLGMAIAYFLDPAVNWLVRRGLPRPLCAGLAILLFVIGLVLVLLIVVPLLQDQIIKLVGRAPQIAAEAQARFERLMVKLQDWGLPIDDINDLRQAAESNASAAFGWIARFLGGLVSSGLAVVNILSLIFITPVVTFYMLRDWHHILTRIDRWLPRNHATTIRAQAREIDRTLSGFARGQAMFCLIMMVYYGAGLTIAGLDFGFAVGFMTGFLSFIPYVGAITGASLSLVLALIQFDHWQPIAAVGAVFLIGQGLEGYILQPLLIGDRVGLHPLWIIFALLAGAALFGFLGVLVAVPVTAVIGVLARFLLARYLDSEFYAAGDDPEPS